MGWSPPTSAWNGADQRPAITLKQWAEHYVTPSLCRQFGVDRAGLDRLVQAALNGVPPIPSPRFRVDVDVDAGLRAKFIRFDPYTSPPATPAQGRRQAEVDAAVSEAMRHYPTIVWNVPYPPSFHASVLEAWRAQHA